MKKIVLIINGRGGCGKDTLVEAVAEKYRVRNESAIDPVKAAGAILGYEGGKSDADRKFLSDLKALSVAYNDYPTKYLFGKLMRFLDSDDEVLFLHIRERSEIEHFLSWAGRDNVRTMLVRSPWTNGKSYGNPSDDQVESMPYDFTYENERGERASKEEFLRYFDSVIVPAFQGTHT